MCGLCVLFHIRCETELPAMQISVQEKRLMQMNQVQPKIWPRGNNVQPTPIDPQI